MRTIHTFILKILSDSTAPHALRGTLQSADGKQEAQPFTDEAALLELLRQMAAVPARKESEQDNPGT